MRLSIFLLCDVASAGEPSTIDPIARGLELCRAADELDFDTVWVAEHHFDGPGRLPNPAVFLAAAATATRRVRLGPAVAVLPFRHPAITAENYALVDRISGGRLEMGVGSGTVASEFAELGLDVEGKQRAFDESLETLIALWNGTGDTALNTAPLQAPPTIHVATNRVDAALAAGRRGLALLTLASPTLESLDAVGPRLEAHRAGLDERGVDPAAAPRSVALFAGVGETPAACRDSIEPWVSRFARAQGVPFDGETLYDTMRSRGTAAFGDAGDVATTLGRLRDMGADEAILWLCFADMPAATAIETMRRVRDDVRPRLG